MSKTLVIIVNHNLPECTNRLYEELRTNEGTTYHTMVMGNGSKPEYLPALIHIRFETNLFFGGALNEAFKIVLQDDQYDSLLFLNNDIEVTAEVFVNLLRKEMFLHDFTLLSPCVAGRAQPWKQMQSWRSPVTREVKWIDLMAPLFHRQIIETFGQFDPELYYGWGQELVCFDLYQEKGWKTRVCDHISIVHLEKQTLLQNRLFEQRGIKKPEAVDFVSLNDSHAMATQEYCTYFSSTN